MGLNRFQKMQKESQEEPALIGVDDSMVIIRDGARGGIDASGIREER